MTRLLALPAVVALLGGCAGCWIGCPTCPPHTDAARVVVPAQEPPSIPRVEQPLSRPMELQFAR